MMKKSEIIAKFQNAVILSNRLFSRIFRHTKYQNVPEINAGGVEFLV